MEKTAWVKLHVCINLYIPSTLVLIIYCLNIHCIVFYRGSDIIYSLSQDNRNSVIKLSRIYGDVIGVHRDIIYFNSDMLSSLCSYQELELKSCSVMDEVLWKQLIFTYAPLVIIQYFVTLYLLEEFGPYVHFTIWFLWVVQKMRIYWNVTLSILEGIGSLFFLSDDILSDFGTPVPIGWVIWKCNNCSYPCMVWLSMPWSVIDAYLSLCGLSGLWSWGNTYIFWRYL